MFGKNSISVDKNSTSVGENSTSVGKNSTSIGESLTEMKKDYGLQNKINTGIVVFKQNENNVTKILIYLLIITAIIIVISLTVISICHKNSFLNTKPHN